MDFVPIMEQLACEKTCIVGMGNNLMRDDAVGLYVADGISERLASDIVTVLNVDDVLENYVFSIAESDCENVVIIDAVQFDGGAGSVIFGRLNEITEIIDNFSTHKLSLSLSGKVLEKYHKKTWLLGIKVRDIDFGIGLSDEVKKSADIIRELLLACINRDKKELIYEH